MPYNVAVLLFAPDIKTVLVLYMNQAIVQIGPIIPLVYFTKEAIFRRGSQERKN